MVQTESEKINGVLKEAEIQDEIQKIYAKIREVEKVEQNVVILVGKNGGRFSDIQNIIPHNF